MSIPLSSEQDKRNYAKEMTSELEMFAENNNGQNLQKSIKGGGKSLLLRNCHYAHYYFLTVKNPYCSPWLLC